MSADGDIVRRWLVDHDPEVLAALARLEAAGERRPLDLAQRIAELEAINRQMSAAEGPQRLAAAEAQRDTLAEATAALLADDDMPNHWDDCVCSYCVKHRAVRAALSEIEGS